jgi:hypothetical protein
MGHELAFWGGNGGSLGLVDFTERMSVGFVMNRWIEGPYETLRFNRILKAVYESLAARSTRAPLVAAAAG